MFVRRNVSLRAKRFYFLRLIWTFIIVMTVVQCGGQPEDDLDPEDVFDPTLIATPPSAQEGSILQYSFQLEFAKENDLTVDYTITDGTASSGIDYSLLSGTLTIPAGETSALLNVQTLQDTLDEYDETLNLVFSNPIGINLSANSIVGTINDDDAIPTISALNITENEGATAAIIISLSQVSGKTIQFNYTAVNNTAIAPTDYPVTSGVGALNPGELTTEVLIPIIDDLVPEPAESFFINFSGVVDALPSAFSTTVNTIDDDAGNNPSTFLNPTSSVEGSNLVFQVTFEFANTIPMNFDVQSFDGSATAPLDYTSTTQTLTVPSGLVAYNITISGANDFVYESDEYFSISLSNFVNLNPVDITTTGTINDDELPPDFSVFDTSLTEGANALIVVTLSHASNLPVIYNYNTSSGSAITINDFIATSGSATLAPMSLTQSFTIATIDDSIDENTENFSFNLSSVNGANVVDNVAIVFLDDNDAPPFIHLGDFTGTEGDTFGFIVSLTDESSFPVSFNIQSYDASAINTSDYNSINSNFTILAGSLSIIIPVATTEDLALEALETFNLSLSSIVNAQPGNINSLGTINDDDTPPDLQILDSLDFEGNTIFSLVTLSSSSGLDITFDYTTVDGVATSAGDFVAKSETITISAGNEFYVISISTVEDTVIEADFESFSISLSSVTGANVIDGSASIAIQDDDNLPDIYINDLSLNEGSTFNFIVTLDMAPLSEVSFAYSTFDGTASQPGDYSSASGSSTFLVGQIELTIPVFTNDNIIDEADRNFTLSLSAVVNGSEGDIEALGTILDDEVSPSIFVEGQILNEGESGDFIISLSEVSGQNVDFVFYTVDTGSAEIATDFNASAASSTIPAGQLSVTLTSSTVEDSLYEAHETYLVSLGSINNASAGQDVVTVTISNNDLEPGLSIFGISISEGTTGQLTLSLSEVSGINSVFSFQSFDGTALGGTDFTTILSTQATIPAGSLTMLLEVVSIEDSIIQGDLNFDVSLSAISDVSLGSSIATITIVENDDIPDLLVFDANIVEGDTASVLVSLSMGGFTQITFDYTTVDGTATSGGDFVVNSGSETLLVSQEAFTILISSVEDSLNENPEVFNLSLSNVVGANVIDDQSVISVTDDDAQLFIDDSITAEGDTLVFVVSLSKTLPHDVSFFLNTADSTAINGSDYTTASGWFTLASGNVSLTAEVSSLEDLTYEDNEYFNVNLSSLTGAHTGDILAVGTINDNDTAPLIYISDGTVTEGGTIAFLISISELSEKDAVFNYDTFETGSAISGSDFTMASTTYTIAPGVLVVTLSAATLEDILDESTENFDVSLTNLVDVGAGDDQGIASILDNDTPPQVFINDAEVDEGLTAQISVTLSQASGQNIEFTWATFDGTALAGTDYSANSATVTMNAGSTSVSIQVISLDDIINQGNLQFDVSISSLVNVNAGNLLATITIDDDEGPPDAPIGITLKNPLSSPSNNITPEFTVSGVISGFFVQLYTDSSCTSPVIGSATAAGTSVDITASPALSEGLITIFATQEDLAPSESPCSTVSLVYDLDLSPPLAATSLSLSSSYATSSTTAPVFSWVQSISGDAASHDVALGTTSGGVDVVNFGTADTGTTHTFSALTLSECSGGLPIYWPSVRVTDTAGNITVATHATGFRHDTTNPGSTGTPSASGDAANDRASTVSWSAGTDNCQIGSYELAIGTTSGATDVLSWKDIGNNLSYQAINGVDGVSVTISNGVFYYTSVRTLDETGLASPVKTSAAWRFITAPDAITDLGYAGRTKSSIDLTWTAPNGNGAAITDYTIEFKNSTIATWSSFSDGINNNTSTSVSGLLASTSYDFRVKAYNGGLSTASNIVTQETAPDDPFFDPTLFSAMNLGGATDSAIVAFDDNTELVINGTTTLSSINSGEVTVISSALGDVVTSTKPFFAAGRLRKNFSDYNKGNIVWNTPSWSGKDFMAVGSRDQDHVITVYAFEEAVITISSGSTTYVDGVTIAAGTTDTYSLSANVGYTIEATKDIVAYQFSESPASDRVTDNLPILPPATDIIGIPSRTGQYTTNVTSTSYNWYESDNSSGSGTLNLGVFASHTGNGAQYGSPAARVTANDPIIGRSNADSDGYDSSPFVPKSFQRQRYAVNHLSEWVSFASDKSVTIQIFEPGQPQSSLTLTKTGTAANTPYFGRLTNVAQGTIFESNQRFAAWYESDEAAEASSSREDETVLFGYDGVGLPVHHKLHMWLDASDSDTLFQQDDCTSIVASNGDSVGCWKDKSLQENNATQSGTKPTWSETVGGFGNQSGINFNGSTQYLNFDQSYLNNTNYTVFAIVHRDSTTSNNYFIGTQSAVANQGLHMGFDTNTSAILGQSSNDITQSVSGQNENSVGLFYGRLNSSGKKIYYNGLSSTDTTSTQLSSTGQGVIGRGFDTNGFDGQIAEIIVFSRDLSDAEIDLMVEYLKEKWLRPTKLADIRLWMDSEDQSTIFTNTACTTQVTTSGDSVNCWKDKSGNGYQAIYSSGTVQWTNNSSLDVIQFSNGSLTISGGTSGAVFTNSTTLSGAEVFAYMKSNSSTENGTLFHHPAGGGFKAQTPNNGNIDFDLNAGATGSISGAWGANTSTYYRWNFNSENSVGSQQIYRDDINVASDSDASSISIGTEKFTIGAQDGDSSYQNMYLGTLLIYNKKLSTQQRHMIRAYIDIQWK